MLRSRDDVRPGMRALPRGRLGLAVVALLVVLVAVRSGRANLTVPSVKGEELTQAYASIHSVGFPVTIERSFEIGSGECPHVAIATAPAAGTRAAKTQAVTLQLSQPRCAHAPIADAPSSLSGPEKLRGGSLQAAISWAGAHGESWQATVPPLRGGDASAFYENFDVIGVSVDPRGLLTLTVEAS